MTMLLINKEEALVLAKILHQHSNEQYSNGSNDEQLSPFQETLRELQLRVNDFLTGDGEDEEEDEDEEAADEGDDEEESDEEDDGSDDEDEGEEDESEEGDGEDADSDEEEGSDELEPDSEVSGDALHRLTAAPSSKGAIEFEVVDETDQVDVLVDGFREVTDVTHVKRSGKQLEVLGADGCWATFSVTRFPKGWATALPLEELVEVFVE